MNLTLVRHTSVDIPPGICYGQLDVGVAISFHEEKEAILNQLHGESFDVVYSSPLSRCVKLTEALCNNNPINFDNRLMELSFGIWEGVSWESIFNMKESKDWFNDYVNAPCPGGESFRQLYSRVAMFYNDIKKSHKGENILIITHAGVIRTFLSLIQNIPPTDVFDIKIEYGEVKKLHVNN